MTLPPIRSWLYAPGNNAKLLERVFTAGADAVILDLEDAVPPGEKLRARSMVAEAVRSRAGRKGPSVFVRVNHPDSGLADALETLHARSQLVLACRVSGVGSPVDGVYPQLVDDDGLERTTRQSRALGFFGRSALHPRQVPIINAVFTPSATEVAQARQVVSTADAAETSGTGALRLPTGDFVDVAIVRRARAILDLDEALQSRDR